MAKENETEEPGLLLHHWDADGMSSAAILLRCLEGTYETFTPTIGNYLLNEEDKEEIRKLDPDHTIVADMALPKDSIEFLKGFGGVHIFDHHIQERHDVEMHHNPIISGKTPKEYPSCSWVVTEYLELEPDILTILGAFGDRETKLKENERAMNVIQPLMDSFKVGFDDMLRCVHMMDTLHKLGDRKSIREFPWFLMDVTHPNEILSRKDLKENLEKLEETIERLSKRELTRSKENLYRLRLKTPYNIISTVTRKISWSRSDDDIVMVTNPSFHPGETQVYIRGAIPNSKEIIEYVRNKGHSAGGKEDVVGMVIPTEQEDEILDEVIKKL